LSILAIVEFKQQVLNILNLNLQENIQWVTTGPESLYTLERLGIPCVALEDYSTPDELKKNGQDALDRVNKICNYIDKLLLDNNEDIKSYGLKTAFYSITNFFNKFNLVFTRISQLKCLTKKEKHQSIIAFSSTNETYDYDICNLTNSDSFVGDLLELVNLPDTNIIIHRNIIKTISRQNILSLIKNHYKKNILIYNLLMNIRYKTAVNNLGSKKYNICLYGSNNEWFNVSSNLTHLGVKVKYISKELFAPNNCIDDKISLLLLNNMEKESYFRHLFMCHEVDTYPLFKKHILRLLGNSVKYISIYEKAKCLFQQKKISALLCNAKTLPEDHIICKAAQDMRIPVFIYQYGEFGSHYHLTAEFYDLLTTDIYLSYGENVCKFLQEKANYYHTQLLTTGSSSLDKLKRKKFIKRHSPLSRWVSDMKKKRQTICLYATTNYFQNNWYAGYDPPPSDIKFYRTQFTLFNGLLNIKDLSLVYKLHPNPIYLKPPFLSNFKSDSLIVIHNEYGFSDLLQYADLIVLDWPSTTLLQSLTTDKPVFVVMKHLKYFTEARTLLERRAICSDEPEQLLSNISCFLRNNIYPADVNDNAFLKMYGTFLDDGNSHNRAAAVILNNAAKYRMGEFETG